ncbi:MAG: hypothetical protein GTO40_23115 [Deltaproteobacteria bacterium]|nr:hypothetical protein [Deltaproteobacteria bacterium]
MAEKSRWVTRQIECPEERGKSELLVELRNESGKEVVNAISCDNPYLQDIDGGDCEWSCWQEVSKEKE